MHAQWLNFAYHYGIGGIIFLLGVGAMVKAGTLRWERPSDSLLLKGLIGGILTFATVHALWIWTATQG
jgi:hypothetical protein